MVTPGIVASSLKFYPEDYFGIEMSYAYSLRQVCRKPSNTFCLRVQRSSDNTTQDIGFAADGWVDVAAIESFVGTGNTGYVNIWYQQSNFSTTSANNLNQVSSTVSQRPVICENGIVPTDHNGQPIMKFSATNSQRIWTSTNPQISTFTETTKGEAILGIVCKSENSSSFPRQTYITAGLYTDNRFDYALSDGVLYWDHGNYTGLRMPVTPPSDYYSYNNQKLIFAADSSYNEVMYLNGVVKSTQTGTGTYTNNTRRLTIGAFWNGSVHESFFNGYIQEVLVIRKSYTQNHIDYLYNHQSKYFPD